MNTFTKNTIHTIFTNLAILVIGLIPSIIIARVLGPEGKGIYALSTVFVNFLMVFASLGICSAVNYYVAHKDFPLPEIFGNTLVITLVVSLFSMAAGAVFIVLFSGKTISGVPTSYLYLSLFLVPFCLIILNLGHIFIGLQKIKQYNSIMIIKNSLDLLFIFVLLYIFKFGITGAIVSHIFSVLISSFIVFVLLSRLIGKISVRLHIDFIKKISAYGAKAYLNGIINIFSYKADIFLVNFFLNPMQVGFYASAAVLAGQLWIVSNAASMALFPSITGETDEHKRRRFTPFVCRASLLITFIMVLFFYFLSGWLIPFIYSSVFSPTIKPFQILLIGVVSLVTWQILSGDLSARGKPELNTYIYGSSIVLNIILNIILIPKKGIIGAAWASVFSYTAASIGALYIYCRITGNLWTQVILPQKDDFKAYVRIINNIWRRNDAG
ncbi:MAG: hypothetical protein AUJ70_00145 [Candidatus Omnitrophica bacterium CG1_02_40_15]|nr:MAG: hypothetical protein AUJ70_00145 [Candidatus Omnitrophica bacterium CG1_02_40_15]